MILNAKKLRKLRADPKLFFKDAIEKRFFALNNIYKKYLPKRYKAFTKYTIVSAVYNVEKYLDDYFNSIINQRLDFKNNIFMILVDDGSTDNSANIIKKYQEKYPKNVVYLHKKNGGQASARNLGLKYMQENHHKTPWVTFTDPDDFLDRNYFYEIDRFLAKHQDENVCMISCNIIFYHEGQKRYKNNHSLNFKFKEKTTIRGNLNLDDFIQLSAASSFVNINYLNNLLFDEKLKPNFEDAKFINQYLLENINLKSAFLSKTKYFYRKREDNSSTLDLKFKSKDYYLNVAKNGYLNILTSKDSTPLFIRNLVLYDLYWQIKDSVNSPEKLFILDKNERKEYLGLLDKNFYHVSLEDIMSFCFSGFHFFYKVGILNCFKNEHPYFQKIDIEDYDPHKEQILITYYTGNDRDSESVLIDGKRVYIDYEKIVKYDFLDRVFCYQKRLWVSVPKIASGKLEVLIGGKPAMVCRYNEYSLCLKRIRKEFKKRLPKSNIWLLIDRDYKADDNAEHLYRYIMQNHPGQKIVFALKKGSVDWDRLKKEGFRLVDFGSYEFERIVTRASKIISSHADEYLMKYITLRQQFIFLQHGVTKDDISRWLNKRKINILITATQAEYNSIVNNYTRYKFSKKEVVLTGFARHDALLKKNTTATKQIFVMPTWRANIVDDTLGSRKRELKDNFRESEYAKRWTTLLNNNVFKEICDKYFYKVVFSPHSMIVPYLKDFKIPPYIKIASKRESVQDLFCNSSLMITDYSSTAFEMAYLGKPTIYYQFDREAFFSSHTLQKGYFNYKKDAFGPIVENENELFKELEELLKNCCKPLDVYKDNIESVFKFKDGKCLERIYNVIKQDMDHNNAN